MQTEKSNDIKINASRNRIGFFVDGLVKCTSVTWKLDTGAKKTFITEDQFYKIPPENRPILEPARTKFANASGQTSTILKLTLEFLLVE